MKSEKDKSVTVVVERKARKGKVREFEGFLEGIIEDATQFEGHLGATVFRPLKDNGSTYIVIFRFDSQAHLRVWEHSEIKRKWFMIADELSDGNPIINKYEGLVTWYNGITNQKTAPSKIKMTFITWLAIYPLITIILVSFGDYLNVLAVPVRTLILTLVLVPLMAYFAIPLLTRLFKKWLEQRV